VLRPSPLYKRHRFPVELISHAVWLSYRFLLSYRDVEELLAERGGAVSYETIRRWCTKFGQDFADGLRRRRPCPGDKWHCDEVQLKINGREHWLWRAVDQEGVVLDILVQPRRNQEAAEAFLRRVVQGQGYQPRVVITDRLASYPPALRHVRSILAEYCDYYNRARPHRSLHLETARPPLRPRAGPIQSVRARPVLNGLHHAYERAA
jgi:putative transposase